MKNTLPIQSFDGSHATSLLLCLLALAVLPARVAAQSVPPMINYQGRLVNSNGVPLATGDYELAFSIHDAATGGAQVWGPQVFDGVAAPGHGARVPVVQGHFNVILGPADTNGAAISAAFNGTNRYLEIRVGTNAPLLPRQQVLTAPYAFRASHAETATSIPGSVTTGPLTLYVSTNGLDLNDGLTPATAKQSIQAAIDLVPSDVRHPVRVNLAPGSYFETVNILNKWTTSVGIPIQIEGVRTNPALVRIDGFTAGGRRQSALRVQASGVLLAGVTMTNHLSYAFHAAQRSNVDIQSCAFDDLYGLSLQDYSFGLCGACIFQMPNTGDPGNAVLVEGFSQGIVPVNNSVTGYTRGISVTVGSILRGSPVFSGNALNIETSSGGLHFP